MKGLLLLLSSLGIKIDPAQIEDAFQRGKTALPEIAAAFEELKASQKRMEEKLDRILRDSDDIQADKIKEEFHARLLNGPVSHA